MNLPLPRRRLLRAGGLALLLGRPLLSRGAEIVAVRTWPAEDYTRVTLESDEALRATHFQVDEGRPRLVIDVEGLTLNAALRELVGKVQPDDPYLAGLRVGQFKPEIVRLVFDLKQPIQPEVFTLAPVAAYRHRLVFDLYPERAPDPLLALLREREPRPAARPAPRPDAASRAAGEVQDALGELIGRVDRPQGATAGKRPESPAVVGPRTERLIIVALDPGHGGEDPGAIGPTGLKEKDVVLQIAHQFRERLLAVPNMRVMMTRDSDFFVPLHERVGKARRVQADLFISLHADAFTDPSARGASVFALSERGATSAAARWMATKENASDFIGGLSVRHRDKGIARTLLDMSTSAQIRDSMRLGREMLGHIGRVGRLHAGRVEQAGFAVLKAPDIPSILVESAFISNPQEEAHLRDPAYQTRLVDALMTGLKRYFEKNPPMARQRTV